MHSEPITLRLGDDLAGQPLALLLQGLLGAVVELPLARGGVWLNGRRVADPSMLAPAGAVVTLHRPPGGVYAEVAMQPQDILYEDAWVLALNKRPGWYTGATPWDTQGNALAALRRFLEAREGAAATEGPPYLHLAHQLDRGTSGVLLFSRRSGANAPLLAAFAGYGAHKRYLCLCAGTPSENEFEARTGHGRERGGRFRIYPPDQVGLPLPGSGKVKSAHTRFGVLRRLGGAALLSAEPLTGRSHQIRLHAAHLGHPLLGDTRYGGPDSYKGCALAFPMLHASRLELPHPHTGAALRLEAPLPELFDALIGGAEGTTPLSTRPAAP
jgi:23S rRNA pseudouridine1911/1915/1917 synthase